MRLWGQGTEGVLTNLRQPDTSYSDLREGALG